MAKKSNIKEAVIKPELKKSKKQEKPSKKSIKTKRKMNFDFAAHNKLVAKKRGESWRKKLLQKKLDATEKLTFIKRYRVTRGISQRGLLKLTSLRSLTSLGKIERGDRTASHKVAMEISKALGVSAKVIFTSVDKSGKARYQAKMI